MKLLLKQHHTLTFFALVLTATLLGCGGTKRQSIEGTVTYGGEKVAQGSIKLIPQTGTKGPSGGALIKDGKFSIPADKGVYVGTFRVELLATKETGRQSQDVMGEVVKERVQYLPPKYNRESTLTQEITSGHNELTFKLTP